MYERARGLMLACRRSHPMIAAALFDAFEANDPVAVGVYAEKAVAALAEDFGAQRRLEADQAARAEERRAVLEPEPFDEDAAIERAANSLTRAVMLGSRQAYLREVHRR